MMARQKAQRFADQFAAGWENALRETDVHAMVMGPSLRGRVDERTKAARALRKAIIKRCDDLGVAVVPEHKRLVAITEKSLKRAHNLCFHELKLAEECDVIIIVPASPGPLVELGMFAERSSLDAKKVLIVFDGTYKRRKSFINHGPRRAYGGSKATIVDVDYSKEDHMEKVLAAVEALVQYQQASKVFRRP